LLHRLIHRVEHECVKCKSLPLGRRFQDEADAALIRKILSLPHTDTLHEATEHVEIAEVGGMQVDSVYDVIEARRSLKGGKV
jgi:hypothetical protein